MIDVEINGQRETVAPGSVDELRGFLRRSVPSGQVIYSLRVNGHERGESTLDESEIASIRQMEVHTATPRSLAEGALPETHDWIGRICGVLETLAQDLRLGQSAAASDQLIEVIDALQVLLGLLGAIRAELAGDGVAAAEWDAAERALLEAVAGFEEDMVSADPVRLADRVGYTLPRVLVRFRGLIEDLDR